MSRWQNAAEYAEELDHQLEELATTVRRASGATTDAELLQARWHATGLERARELLREVLHAPPAARTHCPSQSSTGIQCTLAPGHTGLHHAAGQEWLTHPAADPLCSRCMRRQSRHAAGGRDPECPDGFVARADD
jgi:hypothetical protein